MNQFENERILRLPEVISITGLSKTSIYEAIKANTFPQPIKISTRSIGFLKSECDTWLKERADSRLGVIHG